MAFIDIDDTWSNLKIEKQLKKIKKEKSDIIYNNHWIVKNDSNHWLDKSGKTLYSKNELPSLNMSYEILNNYPITISTVMVKRKVFFDVGAFNKKFEIKDVIEELIRWDSPLQFFQRWVTEDTELAGFKLEKNS